MKKLLCILLTIVVVFSLTACLSEAQKIEADEKKTIATNKFEDFLHESDINYKIKETEQIVSGSILKGYTVTPFTKFVVESDGLTYNFYYDISTDEVWSDVNYEKVTTEFKEYFSDIIFEQKPNNVEFDIMPNISEFNALRHEDTSAKDVLEKSQNDANSYLFKGFFSYQNQSITPQDFNFDKIYSEINNIRFVLINKNEKFCSNTWAKEGSHLVDYMYIEDIAINDSSERQYNVEYNHQSHIEIDELTFSYNDRFINLNIQKTEDYAETVTGTDTKFYKFTPINVGYELNILPKNENLVQTTYEINTDEGLKINITEKDFDIISIYSENKFVYNDIWFYTKHDNVLDSINGFGKIPVHMKEYTDIVSLYKAENIK